MSFEDLLYEIRNGVAWITINRPEKMNSFRGTTCDELIRALYKAGYDKTVGAIVLAGAFLLIGLPAAVLSKASDRLPSGAGTYTVPSSEAMIEGRDIFRSTCASCHALAANARGVYGPDLDEVLGAPGADPKATATRVEGAIKTGGVTGKQMPVGLLSGTDAKLVSDYIAEVAGK